MLGAPAPETDTLGWRSKSPTKDFESVAIFDVDSSRNPFMGSDTRSLDRATIGTCRQCGKLSGHILEIWSPVASAYVICRLSVDQTDSNVLQSLAQNCMAIGQQLSTLTLVPRHRADGPQQSTQSLTRGVIWAASHWRTGTPCATCDAFPRK